MKLYFKQIELGPLQNFVYLIGSLETKEVAVVDPAWDVPRILQTAQQDGMKITQAIISHTHFDHINGLETLVSATDCQVVIHKKEAPALTIEKSNVQAIEGGQEISVGSLKLSFLHTPGHTPGSQCFLVGDRLVTGDTLFIGGCGRSDLPGGDPELLYQSLQRLNTLDDQISVYPGHNYAPVPSDTLAEEKKQNPFLMAPDLDSFLNMVGGVRRHHG